MVGIVCAGAAGLALALLLQRAGVSCGVLERQDAASLCASMKAGMLGHRTVELLKRHGLADTILERGRRIGSCEFRAGGDAFVLDYAALCGGRWAPIYPSTSAKGTVYGIHPRGFAGSMHRSATMTASRLPRVWRRQEFSNLMLGLFNAAAGFAYGLRRARLDQILGDPQFSRFFARSYVGVDA